MLSNHSIECCRRQRRTQCGGVSVETSPHSHEHKHLISIAATAAAASSWQRTGNAASQPLALQITNAYSSRCKHAHTAGCSPFSRQLPNIERLIARARFLALRSPALPSMHTQYSIDIVHKRRRRRGDEVFRRYLPQPNGLIINRERTRRNRGPHFWGTTSAREHTNRAHAHA